jgi:nicotinamide phosphoribosyltransferase
MSRNLLLQSDSYKYSHFAQLPPATTSTFSYVESRGGRYGRTVFFGLQAFLREYLRGEAFTFSDIADADAFCKAHGVPFNRAGFQYIHDKFGGELPIRIRAVPEGTVVPTRNVLMTVESTDSECAWLPSFLETMLLRAIWYPTTVATQSWHVKRIIKEFLDETSDDPAGELPFKLHDFGARGVSSSESAAIGGAAHLVNFKGSDTVEGIRYANEHYSHKMAAFSIPAMEHSTVTSWGREREADAYRNMLDQFTRPGALVACVSDSYDVWNAIERIWCGELRAQVESSGATVVVRLDSGDPVTTVLRALRTFDRHVNMRVNLKGFKVLPKCWRLLQGDGVNEDSIRDILTAMRGEKFSASNIAFGMGGALLQKVDRDTLQFAMKCSSATIDGKEVDVFKCPVDQPDKSSKRGRLTLTHDGSGYATTRLDDAFRGRDQLVTVFENGELQNQTTLDEVRARAEKAL